MEADPGLPLSLANNAKQWLAHCLAGPVAGPAVFEKVHAAAGATYGVDFLAQVYRLAFARALPGLPETERAHLLACFQQAFDKALDEHYTATKRSVGHW